MNFKSLYLLGISATLSLASCGPDASESSAPEPVIQKPIAAKVAKKPEKTAEQRGARVYKKCRVCHTLKEGEKHKVGPNLYAVMDARAGEKEGFNYSKVMSESDIIWTDENLSGYLERPNKFMPGNQMSFIGLRKAEDRADVIAYLRQETAPQ